MFNNQMISNLEALQKSLSVSEYKANYTTPGCGNGPTNCQNQW